MAQKKRMIGRIIGAVVLVAWIVAITSLSGETASESSARSGPVVSWIVSRILSLGLSSQSESVLAEQLTFWVRKAGHFSEFCLLGAIATVNTRFYALSSRIRFLLAAGLCAFVAVGDEVHQLFVPGRSCELRDMLIDFSGGCCGILFVIFVIYLFGHRKKKKKKKVV